MKSITKIKKQVQKKTDSRLAETILVASRLKNWKRVAEILAGPRKNRVEINLNELNNSKSGGVIVPGKILSQGEIAKKIKVVAVGFSEKAKEKLKKAGCEVLLINEEIKKNPEMKDLEVFRE